MNKFELWTDGSNSGPQDRGGWCAIIVSPTGMAIAYTGCEAQTTSNRMELTAVIQGLIHIGEFRSDVTVHVDSAYVKNVICNRWYMEWQRNGWLSHKKDPVANQDLWIQLIALVEKHLVNWVKVKGHGKVTTDKNRLNILADKLAVQAKVTQSAGVQFVDEV